MPINKLANHLSRALDMLGIVALAVTALLLAGSYWFVDDFVRGILLGGVFPWLLTSTVLFVLARIIDLSGFALTVTRQDSLQVQDTGDEADAANERTVPGLRILSGGKKSAGAGSRIDNAA